MPSQEYYPSLSDLIRAEAIPGDFEALEDLVQSGLDLILKKMWYKNLAIQISSTGETKHYSLELLTRKLSLPLFGSGMSLVFFRDSNSTLSSFPIVLDWTWPIYKYIEGAIEEGFSYLPEAFIGVLLELVDIEDEKELLGEIVNAFLNDGDNTYQSFFLLLVTKINSYDNGAPAVTAEVSNVVTQLGIVETEVTNLLTGSNRFTAKDIFDLYEDNTILFTAVESIKNSIETLESDLFLEIDLIHDLIQILIGEFSDLNEKFKRLERLFKGWLGDVDEQDFRDLLIPQFALELKDINMALEFPRKWLVPAIPNPNILGTYMEDPDVTHLSALEYTVGNLKFSTKKGFEFENQSAFTFERAYIGKTGIMLQFINLKVDMSKSYNIPEADADGRPDDFQGVYCEKATVTLPEKWFKNQDPGTTVEIFGNNMLIGTGGLSGVIGLETPGVDKILWANIGDNGFRVGFKRFDIEFKQNKVLSSSIQGALEIPKFIYPAGTIDEDGNNVGGTIVRIGIDGHIHDNGDFNLTASATPPYPIELENVFTYNIKSLELGRQDDDFYIGTSGLIQFEGFLKTTLKLKEIEVERLRIYSDGTIEFEGGSIALVEPIVLPLGPVAITVSAIHYGSHQKEVNGVMRKFNYFGFDGGISVDPLGVEIRGDGVKYYYCTDDLPNKPTPYLHIQTLYLDLTIPATTPAAIINGWLSIPEPGTSPEYAGGIKLQLPQAKITGSADMKLMPKYPAFIIDASIEFPVPIPLGPVAIYGFRGLIGYRYVAEKEAAGLVSGVDSWYDYYKKAPRGIHVTKFNGPDRTTVAGTPFSIGAGASLGTSPDNGTILNIKAMVLLSIPSLFMIDGRAAILSARLGLDASGDPPFFAFIAIGDNSLELGFGADFKMPTSSGDILKLYADVQAGFFFNDASKWYVNIGTKTNPVTARVLTLLTITSYVMLSAKGIEAGARGEFNFYREYGPIKVHAWAYIEVGGKISFEKPQFGAYMAAGVGADIDIKIVSLYAAFDVLFGVEAPKPFLIYGEFRYCVKIKIAWIFKFKFCGKLAVSWEFNSDVDRARINPMIDPASSTPTDPVTIGGEVFDRSAVEEIVKGVSMLSNETFDVAFLQNVPTNTLPGAITDKIIPIDTYIDIRSKKGLLPGAIDAIIGGVNNPPIRYAENVPPEKYIKGKEVRQVKHVYSIESIEIKSWNPSGSNWQTYHPYEALYPSDPTVSNLKVGQFQKTDGQYSTIRLLATTPFSYTEQGQPGWFVPEQNGITAASLFCQGVNETHECADFLEKNLGQKYYCYDENHLFYANEVAFFLKNKTDEEFGVISNESNTFSFAQSLQFENTNVLEIRLPEPSVNVEFKLTTFSQGVIVRYYASLIDDTTSQIQYGNPNTAAPDPLAPHEVYIMAADLSTAVSYNQPTWLPVTRIEISPQYPNSAAIEALIEQIALIEHNNNLIALGLLPGEQQSTVSLEKELAELKDIGCDLIHGGGSGEPHTFPKECSEDALCDLLYKMRKTELCFRIDKVSDWGPIATCAHQFLDILSQFNKDYPRCNIYELFEKLRTLLITFESKPNYETFGSMYEEFLRVLAIMEVSTPCGSSGCDKDEELCAVWDLIWEIRNNCLPHPSQSNPKAYGSYSECFNEILIHIKSLSGYHIYEELLTKSKPIYTFISKMTAQNYANAWEAVQCILEMIEEAGNCNCDPEDRKCYTLLHQICWLSFDAYQYNINIPGQAAIEADALATVDGITKFIQPVWRPETSYYVSFVLRDIVDNDVFTDYTYTYGFTTGGPIGYFHTHPNSTYGDPAFPEKYALTGLRQYIDYQRSYPNADGNLLSAKPLFYADETTKIDLFFVKAYATHFFQKWEAYNGQVEVDGRIKIVIKDPREGTTIVNPPFLNYNSNVVDVPQTIESWADDPNPLLPHVFDQYANLIEANLCVPTGGDAIIPKSSYLNVIPKNLKPLKVYTAIVNNLYDADRDGNFNTDVDGNLTDDETKEVHKFTFQTSRYAGFKDQINSYIMAEKIAIKPIVKSEVDDYSAAYSGATINAVMDTITNTPNSIGDALIGTYPHPFDRAVEGLLGLAPFASVTSNQFNQIRDTNNADEIIAVVIVSPIPFNNLRVPETEVLKAIRVLDNTGIPSSDYKVVLSSDYTQALIMHNSLSFAGVIANYQFEHPVTRVATFEIKKGFTSTELQAAYDLIDGNPNVLADGLTTEYQDPFDRIVEGIFGFNPLVKAVSTEFNLVKDENNGDIPIAIIIRNPEPFNNPKIPIADALDTVEILSSGGAVDTSYKMMFSKDYSQVIIMRSSLTIPAGLFNFRFKYKIWDGSGYIVPGTGNGYSSDEAGTILIDNLQLV